MIPKDINVYVSIIWQCQGRSGQNTGRYGEDKNKKTAHTNNGKRKNNDGRQGRQHTISQGNNSYAALQKKQN